MKTVKTVNGFKKIDNWNDDLVPLQLRTILQEHRSTLIERILSDIPTYIFYKFGCKPTARHIEFIQLKLNDLKVSGIDLDTYHREFDAVLKNEFTALNSSVFYTEIDTCLKPIFGLSLFNDSKRIFLQ